jgi:hypothetical protein
MSTFVVNGPVSVGDTGQDTDINGIVELTDVTTTHGDIVFADGANKLKRLAPSTPGFFLSTAGAGADPVWAAGATGIDDSFSVDKLADSTFNSTPTIVSGWSIAGATRFNTGGFNTATGIFTAGYTARYFLSATISFKSTGGGGNSGSRILELYNVGGASVICKVNSQPNANSTIDQYASISSSVSLTAGDTVAVRFYRSNMPGGVANNITTDSFFSGLLFAL